MFDPLRRWTGADGHNDLLLILDMNIRSADAAPCVACWWPLRLSPQHEPAPWMRHPYLNPNASVRNEGRETANTMPLETDNTMPRPPPPPRHFPQPFANPGAENSSRSATRGATQPTAGNPLVPAIHSSQGGSIPSTSMPVRYARLSPEFAAHNDGTYLPQQPSPPTSLQSSATLPVRRDTRLPAPAPAPALTHLYSPSYHHPPSHLPSSGSVPQPPSFPVPSVPGGYGAPSNPSGLVPPPSRPMTERAMTTNAHNVQVMGHRNVAAPGSSHQRSATVGRSHRACIIYGVPANYA